MVDGSDSALDKIGRCPCGGYFNENNWCGLHNENCDLSSACAEYIFRPAANKSCPHLKIILICGHCESKTEAR